jgi:cytochrome c-type biogenesis protein CcmH
VTDDQVNTIASQLFCPVCENIPLDVCGTKACADWRQEIRTMLSQGKSEQEIKQYFAARYGQRVLATPEARGANLLVWVLPVLGAVIGLAILILALRRMAPGALGAEVSTSKVALDYGDLDPEYVARVEREFKEFSS